MPRLPDGNTYYLFMTSRPPPSCCVPIIIIIIIIINGVSCLPCRLGAFPFSPPPAAVFKNAGLAYLHLVKSPPLDAEDAMWIRHDPWNASDLLPWETLKVIPLPNKAVETNEDESNARDTESTETGGAGKRARVSSRKSELPQEEVVKSLPLRAAGPWRDAAAKRFLEQWRSFLEHQDARADSQYETIDEIYRSIVQKVDTRKKRPTKATKKGH